MKGSQKMEQKQKTKLRGERGITLIALIVMIIVLVILSAVVIKGITGDSLIGTTSAAAEEYNITSYKEQVEQEVRGTVVTYASKGEEASLTKIAEELNNETLWVKTAVANTNTDITNEDILVTTTDGYVFQIYYNSTYGVVYVEYIGKDDGKEFPNLKARFEKSLAAILAETKAEGSKLELIYRGEVVGEQVENPKGEQRLKVDEIGTGWYKVRVTASNEKLRYAWIKATTISEKLTEPDIIVTPVDPNKGEGNDGWYIGAVKVKIETDNPYVKEMHYSIIENGIVIKEDEIYTEEFTVETNGTTRIIAWTEDGVGYASEETSEDIKIDSTKPTLTHEEKSAKAQVGEWYKADVEITIKGDDAHSRIDGYYYMVVRRRCKLER